MEEQNDPHIALLILLEVEEKCFHEKIDRLA